MENIKKDNVVLDIKNLTITFEVDGDVIEAVNDVSLTVHEGETLGLVGETGAGKTTTALSILRLLPDRIGKIKQGEILLDGQNLLECEQQHLTEFRLVFDAIDKIHVLLSSK